MKTDEDKIKEKLFKANEYLKNKKFTEAEKLYKEILILNKNHINANFYLGTLYTQIKRFDLATSFLMKAKETNPNNPNINLNLGNLFLSKGNPVIAMDYFDKAIQIKPNFTLAYFNKGIILNNQKKYQEAIKYFEKVIKIEPNNIQAYNVISIILQQIGEFKKSLFYLKKSLNIAPNNLRIINTLTYLLSTIQLSNIMDNNSSEFTELFCILFKKNSIDHNALFNNAKNFILFEKDKKIVQQLIDEGNSLLNNDVVQRILKNELFLLILQKSLFRDEFLEDFLCKIRKEFLLSLKTKNQNLIKVFLDFIISLAEQSFLNEYLFFQTDDEIQKINNLKIKIEKDQNINEFEISILASYLPLNSSKLIKEKLINYSSKKTLFNDLIKIQIKDSLREEKLKSTINSFGIISDNISKKVRVQYEENPYPRWRYANIAPKNNFLTVLNNNISPNKIISNNDNVKRDILIAGCGTGQQLVSKTSYQNADILAVDLSLSSLSFAKRKLEELNHTNVKFLHGDILNLNCLNKKFSVIECVGVLHHLKDPEEGLKILLSILEPNGYLKLGLYSEFARNHIVETREFIQKQNIDSSISNIRRIREMIKKDKKNTSFQKLNYNYDFYSTSNVRDLIFHVQERRYNLPQITRLLRKYNLKFLGFTNSLNKKEYTKNFPNDLKCISLENWHNFEINNPDIFKQMYQFWVKK